MKQLTERQINQLTSGKKHWSEKKQHLISLAKNFGIVITTDDELKYLIEIHCPSEQKRIQVKYFNDSQSGKIRTKFTPTDVKGDFAVIVKPTIGCKYHLSWAFSGAVFVLRRIEGNKCYMDNPKYERKTLLECNISDLRALRNKHKKS